jgi:hypothetical protein
MRELEIYRVSLRYSGRDISISWFMVAEREVTEDRIFHEIENLTQTKRGETR